MVTLDRASVVRSNRLYVSAMTVNRLLGATVAFGGGKYTVSDTYAPGKADPQAAAAVPKWLLLMSTDVTVKYDLDYLFNGPGGQVPMRLIVTEKCRLQNGHNWDINQDGQTVNQSVAQTVPQFVQHYMVVDGKVYHEDPEKAGAWRTEANLPATIFSYALLQTGYPAVKTTAKTTETPYLSATAYIGVVNVVDSLIARRLPDESVGGVVCRKYLIRSNVENPALSSLITGNTNGKSDIRTKEVTQMVWVDPANQQITQHVVFMRMEGTISGMYTTVNMKFTIGFHPPADTSTMAAPPLGDSTTPDNSNQDQSAKDASVETNG